MKKNKDDKLKLVNEEVDNTKEEQIQQEVSPEEIKKKERQKRRRKRIRTVLIFGIITMVALFIAFWWQAWKFDLRGFADAFTLAFVVSLLATWVMFVYNKNILSPLIHGVKTFGLMLVGKKPKDDYYTYMKKIEDEPIPKFIIIYSLIYTVVLGITMTILIILSLKYPRQ
ncbi:MAG: hypothetical protein ACOX56_01700 [Acholeplasmataceae bacterium]|jgi:hypothetical protein